jgi:hypothetical protein
VPNHRLRRNLVTVVVWKAVLTTGLISSPLRLAAHRRGTPEDAEVERKNL